LRIFFDVPDALCNEIQQAARERHMSPAGYVGELIEADAAARRLPGVLEGRCGARVPGWTPSPIAEDDTPVTTWEPVDPPMLADLDSLDGIL
jgi:hypothetical protein